MCGINGILALGDSENLKAQIELMNTRIIHRGPDDDGVKVVRGQGYSVALGMRRLAIIDIESGAQPMGTDTLELVFNGEIYNFRELRAELENEGLVFRTQSDTEVILKLYATRGIDGLKG